MTHNGRITNQLSGSSPVSMEHRIHQRDALPKRNLKLFLLVLLLGYGFSSREETTSFLFRFKRNFNFCIGTFTFYVNGAHKITIRTGI